MGEIGLGGVSGFGEVGLVGIIVNHWQLDKGATD